MLWHHIELRFFEEQSHDASLHVALLLQDFVVHVGVNLLRVVAGFDQVAA